MPVFRLIGGWFWSLWPPTAVTHCTTDGEVWHRGVDRRCRGGDVGPETVNLKKKIQNINAPQGRIPCAIFAKFLGFMGSSFFTWQFKFGSFAQGIPELWGFDLGSVFSFKFQHPVDEPIRPMRIVLEVQKWHGPPASPCEFGGTRTLRTAE